MGRPSGQRSAMEISLSVQKFATYIGYEDPETLLVAIKKGKVDVGEAVDKFIYNTNRH